MTDNQIDNYKDFQEPDNNSDLNNFWMSFKRFYESKKEGTRLIITKTKDGFAAFFSYRRKF